MKSELSRISVLTCSLELNTQNRGFVLETLPQTCDFEKLSMWPVFNKESGCLCRDLRDTSKQSQIDDSRIRSISS